MKPGPALVVAQPDLVPGLANLEAGEGGGLGGQFGERAVGGMAEIGGVEDDLAGAAAVDPVHGHRFEVGLPDREKSDGIGALAVGVEGGVEIIFDREHGVVVDALQDTGIGHRWRDIGRAGFLFGERLQDIEAERPFRPEIDLGLRRRRFERRGEREYLGGSKDFEQIAT